MQRDIVKPPQLHVIIDIFTTVTDILNTHLLIWSQTYCYLKGGAPIKSIKCIEASLLLMMPALIFLGVTV